MSYAPDYTPTNSFADDETNNASGRSTVRTDELDAQFADLSTAHNELNANVKKIQRDDDKLRDFIVEPYTLSEQTKSILTAAGKNIRGEWAVFVNYGVGDLVQRNAVAYICQTTHNSGPAFNLGFWIAISGDGSAQAWAEQAQMSSSSALAAAVAAGVSTASATAAAAAALGSQIAAAASALAAQNAANSIAGLAPVNLNAYMLSFLASANAAAARSALATPGSADLANQANVALGAALVGFSNRTLYDRLLDRYSIKDAGARAANTGAANLAAINSALALRRTVLVPEEDFDVSAMPTNTLGSEFAGKGRVLLPVTGGKQQINTYADEGKVFIGKEYLYRVYERMRLGFVTPVKAFAFGDSTVAGDAATTAFLIQNLMPVIAQRIGLPVPLNVTNRGVGGTKVSDMNAMPDLAADTDLFIIKYGINDGSNPDGTRLATFATQLRSKLAAIRAAAFGSYTTLAIVLVGPNATSDTPNGRDERWYEQLRGVFVQAARDYKCAYFDTYAYLKDARGAATYWMDDPFADGRAVHPKDMMYQWIWGALLEHMFPPNQIASWRINSVTNIHSSVLSPPVANAPSSYPYGISLHRATTGNGWPEDGMVLTNRSVDGVSLQQLMPFAAGRTIVCSRVANVGGDAWNLWTGQRVAVPLANGWVAYDATNYDSPIAVLGEDGICTLNMQIAGGTITAGTQVGSIPAGLRPIKTVGPFACVLNGGTTVSSVVITNAGAIIAVGALNATLTSVQASFRVA